MFHTIHISSSEKIIYQQLTYDNYEALQQLLVSQQVNLSPLKNISNFSRKYEWMSVRGIVVHELPYDDIIYNANNKPFLKKSNAHLSISHSTAMIAVGINLTSTIGIDIQHITEKIVRIKHKFLDEREQSMCSDNPTELTCFWSIKEALFKLYGIKDAFLKENIKVIELKFDGNRGNAVGQLKIRDIQTTYKFELRKIDDYILAFSVNR